MPEADLIRPMEAPPRSTTTGRILAAWAIATGVLMLAATAFALAVPGAYDAGQLSVWATGIGEHRAAAEASAWLFVLALSAQVVVAVLLAYQLRSAPRALTLSGASVLAIGSFANAIGAFAPFLISRHLLPEGPAMLPPSIGLLSLAISVDAFYNLTLFVGLVFLGIAQGREPHLPRWLGWLAVAAGVASAPVALQAHWPATSGVLVVAGPLWAAWLFATAWASWRAPA